MAVSNVKPVAGSTATPLPARPRYGPSWRITRLPEGAVQCAPVDGAQVDGRRPVGEELPRDGAEQAAVVREGAGDEADGGARGVLEDEHRHLSVRVVVTGQRQGGVERVDPILVRRPCR